MIWNLYDLHSSIHHVLGLYLLAVLHGSIYHHSLNYITAATASNNCRCSKSHNFTLRGGEDPRVHDFFSIWCSCFLPHMSVAGQTRMCVLILTKITASSKPHCMRQNNITLRHSSSCPDLLQISWYAVYVYKKYSVGQCASLLETNLFEWRASCVHIHRSEWFVTPAAAPVIQSKFLPDPLGNTGLFFF